MITISDVLREKWPLFLSDFNP